MFSVGIVCRGSRRIATLSIFFISTSTKVGQFLEYSGLIPGQTLGIL